MREEQFDVQPRTLDALFFEEWRGLIDYIEDAHIEDSTQTRVGAKAASDWTAAATFVCSVETGELY